MSRRITRTDATDPDPDTDADAITDTTAAHRRADPGTNAVAAHADTVTAYVTDARAYSTHSGTDPGHSVTDPDPDGRNRCAARRDTAALERGRDRCTRRGQEDRRR
jgi:hypothetical protein